MIKKYSILTLTLLLAGQQANSRSYLRRFSPAITSAAIGVATIAGNNHALKPVKCDGNDHAKFILRQIEDLEEYKSLYKSYRSAFLKSCNNPKFAQEERWFELETTEKTGFLGLNKKVSFIQRIRPKNIENKDLRDFYSQMAGDNSPSKYASAYYKCMAEDEEGNHGLRAALCGAKVMEIAEKDGFEVKNFKGVL